MKDYTIYSSNMATISIIPETNVAIDIRHEGRFSDDSERFRKTAAFLVWRARERLAQEDYKNATTLTRTSNTIASIRKDLLKMYAERKISLDVLDKADMRLVNLWKRVDNIPDDQKCLIQTYIQTLAAISRSLRIKANRN